MAGWTCGARTEGRSPNRAAEVPGLQELLGKRIPYRTRPATGSWRTEASGPPCSPVRGGGRARVRGGGRGPRGRGPGAPAADGARGCSRPRQASCPPARRRGRELDVWTAYETLRGAAVRTLLTGGAGPALGGPGRVRPRRRVRLEVEVRAGAAARAGRLLGAWGSPEPLITPRGSLDDRAVLTPRGRAPARDEGSPGGGGADRGRAGRTPAGRRSTGDPLPPASR